MLVFDKTGLLTPPGPVNINLDDFKRFFVDEIPSPERSRLFANYLVYVNDLKALVGSGFYQWVDGSFVTKKKHPGDIDVVNFVPYQVVDENADKLAGLKFPVSLEKYSVDAYFVRVYEEGHRHISRYLADRAEWWHHFESTRIFRDGKTVRKGFLQIEF